MKNVEITDPERQQILNADVPIYDAHVHIFADPAISEHVIVSDLDPEDRDSVLNYMERYQLDKMVLLPPDRIPNPPRDFDYREMNEKVARITAAHPDRVIGTCRINPLFGPDKTRDDLEYFLGEKKLGGIKLVARADFYRPNDLKVMEPVMEKAAKYDVPLLFHSGHPSRDLPSLQGKLASHYPEVRVVIAHMGLHDFFWEAVEAARDYPNVYVDMSQAWPYDIKVFLREVGAEKMMYGTDSPFQSPRVEQLKVREAVDSVAELQQVFHKTATKVWGF
ncbi:MAG: amidohydrolase family protein [Bacillota bacterium]